MAYLEVRVQVVHKSGEITQVLSVLCGHSFELHGHLSPGTLHTHMHPADLTAKPACTHWTYTALCPGMRTVLLMSWGPGLVAEVVMEMRAPGVQGGERAGHRTVKSGQATDQKSEPPCIRWAVLATGLHHVTDTKWQAAGPDSPQAMKTEPVSSGPTVTV